MQKDSKNLIKILNRIMDDPNLVSLNTKIDLESNLISVQFSVLCEEDTIQKNSKEIHFESCRDILTSGFSKNEIEELKERHGHKINGNGFGILVGLENQG